jgi:heat shock protein HtpX
VEEFEPVCRSSYDESMGRRQLSRRDRGLVAQMVLTAVFTPAIVIALVVVMFLSLPSDILAGVGLAVMIGFVITYKERSSSVPEKALSRDAAPELFVAVERLCVVADLERPEIVLHPDREPNSWVVAPPGRTPHLHVTQALLDLLTDDELAAVLAHELSHLANRDAIVMTVVGTPGMLLQKGSRVSWGFWPLQVGMLIACLIGLLSRVGTNSLSRCRELSADAGAAAITGRPSALASALLKVSGAIDRIPRADLRAAAAGNSFNLVAVAPVRSQNPVVTRLGATHPRISERLRALEALEADLHR